MPFYSNEGETSGNREVNSGHEHSKPGGSSHWYYTHGTSATGGRSDADKPRSPQLCHTPLIHTRLEICTCSAEQLVQHPTQAFEAAQLPFRPRSAPSQPCTTKLDRTCVLLALLSVGAGTPEEYQFRCDTDGGLSNAIPSRAR